MDENNHSFFDKFENKQFFSVQVQTNYFPPVFQTHFLLENHLDIPLPNYQVVHSLCVNIQTAVTVCILVEVYALSISD